MSVSDTSYVLIIVQYMSCQCVSAACYLHVWLNEIPQDRYVWLSLPLSVLPKWSSIQELYYVRPTIQSGTGT